jgi:hypothetical protein
MKDGRREEEEKVPTLACSANIVMLYHIVLIPFLVLTSTVAVFSAITNTAQLLVPKNHCRFLAIYRSAQLYLEGAMALTAVKSHECLLIAVCERLQIHRCRLVDEWRVTAATAARQDSRVPHMPCVVGSGRKSKLSEIHSSPSSFRLLLF